jgi:hypothetical protein
MVKVARRTNGGRKEADESVRRTTTAATGIAAYRKIHG